MRHLYIGTYTQNESEGIYICRLDPSSGAIQITGTAPDQSNPSFLAVDPSGLYLYAANELADGTISSYAIAPETGALTLIGRQSSRGAHPCHISIAGHSLLVANYGGGSVAALPILPDGSLGAATGYAQHSGAGSTQRQSGPHPHCAVLVGGSVYVPDLGLDKVMIYRLAGGELIPNEVAYAALAPGAGPRHVASGSDGRTLYVVNELDSTVTVLRRDAQTGALDPMQTVSTLPEGYEGVNYPAEIQLHPSGRFLYVSNREHDSIGLFLVDAATGALRPAGHSPSGGRWPRSFGIDETGRFLVAAHQRSETVVSFAIDQATGELSPTGHAVQIPVPVCVRL